VNTYVAVTEEAPLARVPDGLDPVVAAALPTAGGTGLALVASLPPLAGKTVLVVAARGGPRRSFGLRTDSACWGPAAVTQRIEA